MRRRFENVVLIASLLFINCILFEKMICCTWFIVSLNFVAFISIHHLKAYMVLSNLSISYTDTVLAMRFHFQFHS